jgi:hypothetical protein
MKVLYRNDRPKILNLLGEQALRYWRPGRPLRSRELHCEARHGLVPRQARDLLPFILRNSPSKSRIFENEV